MNQISNNQTSIEQAMRIAVQHQQAGRLPQADQVLRRVLNADPQHAEALHLLGVVSYMSGDIAQAIDLISQAIAVDDDVPLFHANIAEMYRLSKRLDEALVHGQKAVDLDPDLLFGQGNLGLIYFDREEYEKAMHHHEIALNIDPHFAPSLNNMGGLLRRRQDLEGAADYFRRAIKANPQALDAQNNLGEILTRLEQPEEALVVLDRVLALHPRYDSAYCNRAMALAALGHSEEARASYRKALEITPDFVPAYAGLILSGLDFDCLEESEAHARKLLEIDPENADSYNLFGSVLLAQGRTEEAEKAFAQALDLDENFMPAQLGMGHVLTERGDLEGAEAMFLSCVESGENVAVTLCSLVQVKKIKPGDPAIEILEKEAKTLEGPLVDTKAISLHFALGKMYDDLGAYDRAFPHYLEGCRLKRKDFDYSMAARASHLAEVKRVFSADFIAGHKEGGDPSDVPIFVLGMPRSGTTLTEQIIASHPAVHGAGELRDLTDITERFMPAQAALSFHAKMLDATADSLAEMGRDYVAGLRARHAEALKITDKAPSNFKHIGLIKLILPQAKIVHVSRHPLDTCLSCFTRLFGYGQAHSYDLTEIGHYYKEYKDLMDHWRDVLPEGSFYDVRYEDLVDNTEEEARKLIAYCGLEWDDACLEFYKNKRSIRTASVTQVRQPIYKSSKQRWKNYESFLDPLIDALGDALPS